MIKPILFNTEMVQAILDGRKTCTRRIVKGFIPDDAIWGYTTFTPKGCISCRGTFSDGYGEKFFKLPYQKGDILYVRETWSHPINPESDKRYVYRADDVAENGYKNDSHIWHPSIHMPKEATRIWLKVTDVRVERLQDITFDSCKNEGIYDDYKTYSEAYANNLRRVAYPKAFARLWDSTVKKSDIDCYGWNANPWVWVVDFERGEKPKEGDK